MPLPGGPQDDHGYISREFHRRYRLPSNVDQSALSCSLSADGMLTFSGPKVQSGLDAGHSELMTHMWFVMHQPHAGNPKNNPVKASYMAKASVLDRPLPGLSVLGVGVGMS